MYDLTASLSPRTPRSSDHPEVAFPPVRWFSRDGISTRRIEASLHSGTHIDAPALYHPTGASIDKIPLDRLTGSAVVVDVPSEEWFAITPELLDANVEPIQRDDIVILRTGWATKIEDEAKYILMAPGLTREGVDWLIRKKIKMVASDSPSPEHIFMRSAGWQKLRPDIFGDTKIDESVYPAHYGHKQLLANGICLLEGLGGDIAEVTETRLQIMALPMKYAGVEAAPARVVAWP